MPQQYLNICHWNIGGLNVKNYMLCKLTSDALKQLVNKMTLYACLKHTVERNKTSYLMVTVASNCVEN